MKKSILLSFIIGLMIIACLKIKDVRIQHRVLLVRRTGSGVYPELQGYVTNIGNTIAESVLIHLTLVCSYPSPRQAEIEQYEKLIDSINLGPKNSSDFKIIGKFHGYNDMPRLYTISGLTVTWK